MAFRADSDVGESPVWDIDRGGLWWVDLLRGELHYWDGRANTHQTSSVGQSLGFIVPFESGDFVAGTRDGIGVLTPNGGFDLICPVELERPNFRMNDGKCDPQGSLWAGTMSDATHANGSLYRINANWEVKRIADGLSVPNGLGWTRNGELMYLADTGRARLEWWQFDAYRGVPTKLLYVVSFSDVEGGPDGLAVDSEDCAWVCLWGGHGLRRYAPDGEMLESIEIPALNAASCAFGGDDFRDLYITSARYGLTLEQLRQWPLSGSIFRYRPDVGGMPAQPFRASRQ